MGSNTHRRFQRCCQCRWALERFILTSDSLRLSYRSSVLVQRVRAWTGHEEAMHLLLYIRIPGGHRHDRPQKLPSGNQNTGTDFSRRLRTETEGLGRFKTTTAWSMRTASICC